MRLYGELRGKFREISPNCIFRNYQGRMAVRLTSGTVVEIESIDEKSCSAQDVKFDFACSRRQGHKGHHVALEEDLDGANLLSVWRKKK